MKSVASKWLVAAWVLMAPAAFAAPCEPASGEAPIIKLEGAKEELLSALSVSFTFGLTPGTFPFDEIAKATDPCTRGSFEAGGQTYFIFGGAGDSPPRFALGPDPKRMAFVAVAPPAADALKWMRSKDRSKGLSFTTAPLGVLVVPNGATRDIYALFEDIPGDAQLLATMRDALDGKLPRIASFNVQTGETKFLVH
jgi:hypothetical protein